ncbi:hypothetical protein LU631_00470 [Erwinia tracheiphila]|nr:hypothetical protein [Erwinia tracheiphila]UIA88017.1 hypothetical protein LU631_00470 [Erwinia tracheiphila]UIA96609.1 hypothetical protein LU633_00470 [Erwinia tracheiphila]
MMNIRMFLVAPVLFSLSVNADEFPDTTNTVLMSMVNLNKSANSVRFYASPRELNYISSCMKANHDHKTQDVYIIKPAAFTVREFSDDHCFDYIASENFRIKQLGPSASVFLNGKKPLIKYYK